MELKGQQVRHHQFGTGNITEQSQSAVTVMFGGEAGEKRFIYPVAFEQYLELCNPSTRDRMALELKVRHDAAASDRRRSLETAGKLREEERKVALDKKKAESKKKAALRKALKLLEKE